MQRKSKFILDGIILSIVGMSMRGVGLALGAYISRTVGAEAVGLNALVMNVYGFALTFATAGISLTVTTLVAGAVGRCKEESVTEVLSGAFVYAGAFGAVASLALFSFSSPISGGVLGNRLLSSPLRALSLSLIPSSLTAVVSGYFIGRKKVSMNAVLQVFGQIARVLYTVAFLKSVETDDPITAITALATGLSLTEITILTLSLIELFIERRKNRRSAKPSVKAVREVALPIALSAYVRSALVTLEHAIIPKRLETGGATESEALSSYGYLHGMALPLILYPLVPLSSFGSLLPAEFAEAEARGERERMKRVASDALSKSLKYATIVASILFAYSRELGYAVYGSPEAGRFVAILSPVVPLMFLDHVADNMLKGVGEQVYSMWVNIFDAIISVVLVYFLLPVMGISGYALVIIIMEGFNFTLSAIRLYKRVGFKIGLLGSCVYPLLLSGVSLAVTRVAFSGTRGDMGAMILVIKIVFSLLVLSAMTLLLSLIKDYSRASKTTIVAKPARKR